MADDIKQTLGFDASQALETLKSLDQALAGFESKLGTLSNSALVSFNSRAGKTVAALKQITDAANAAAAALGKANSAASAGGVSSGGGGGGGSTTRRSTSSGLSGQDAADALDKLLGNKTSEQVANADKLTQGLRNVGNAAEEGFSKAATASNRFSISWETLVRVVETQFIVRALSALRDAFRTAVDDAIGFQRAVARIQTIAPGESFDKVAAGVRNISDSFNIPLLQAAEGVYQAVSNQVGNLGESLTFTATAAQFAKATNSSLADSIDLLSGAIKSFGLSNDSAEKVAGIFFTAIDKGRVTASELANTFGRIGPSAKQVGISLEELGGAVAAISVKGVKTNESLTQFRGIVTALTKPTDAMKDKLAQLGFSSAEAAVQTLGLDGILQALANTTENSSRAFGKLFPNVRGSNGALALTGENLKEFAADIQAGKVAVNDLIGTKFGTVFQTDAEKVTTALNKIKNALVVDFGQAILHSSAALLQFAGGAERIVAAGTIAIPVLVQLGVAVGAITLALQGARLAALLFASSFGTIGTAATLAVVALGQIKKAIDDQRLFNANQSTDKLTKSNAESTTAFAKSERDRLDAAKTADQERVKSALTTVAVLNQTYLRDLETAKSANKALVENTEASLGKIIHARVQFIEAITKAIADSQEAIRESNRQIAGFKLEKQDLQFTRQTANFSDAQKAFVFIQRSAQTARDAEQALLNAFRSGDKGDQEAAQRLFERANSQLSSAKSLGQGNKALEGTIFNAQNSLLDRRIGLEQTINNLQRQRQVALANEKRNQESLVQQLKEQVKIAVDNTGQFDANGDQFSQADQAKRAAAREKALKNIATLGFQQKDFDVGKALGLGDFIQKIQADLGSHPVQITLAVDKSIAKFQADIRKSLSNIDIQLPFLKPLEEALGKSVRKDPNGIQQGIIEAVNEADILRNKMSQVKINDKSIEDARKEIDSLVQSIDSRKGLRDQAKANTNDPEVLNAINNVDRFKEELVKLAGQSKITQQDIDAIRAKIQNNGNKSILAIDTDLNQLGQIAARIGPIQQALQSTASVALPKDAQAKLAVLDSVLQQIGNTNPGLVLQTAATALQATVDPMGKIKDAVSNSADNAERIARAYEEAARVQLPVVPTQTSFTESIGGMIQGFNSGGFVKAMRYFDRGGFAPKGTDTIPAMLSPGEFVVNARSTRRFFSQLQAMNAGAQPVFRANGGSITNNHNVGDVSIAISGAQHPKLVGREVEQVLLRAKRRGTIR